jgi:hypothetical protein
VFGEHHVLIVAAVFAYVGVGVLAAINAVLEERPVSGFPSCAAVAAVSLLWPLALLAVACALMWVGPRRQHGSLGHVDRRRQRKA